MALSSHAHTHIIRLWPTHRYTQYYQNHMLVKAKLILILILLCHDPTLCWHESWSSGHHGGWMLEGYTISYLLLCRKHMKSYSVILVFMRRACWIITVILTVMRGRYHFKNIIAKYLIYCTEWQLYHLTNTIMYTVVPLILINVGACPIDKL